MTVEVFEIINPEKEALELVVGKRNVRKLMRQGQNMNLSFFETIDMGAFLVFSGILEFGCNDNKKSRRGKKRGEY